jgi:hypothetical protein
MAHPLLSAEQIEAARAAGRALAAQRAEASKPLPPPGPPETSAAGALAGGLGAGALGIVGAVPGILAAGAELVSPAGSEAEDWFRRAREASSGERMLSSLAGAFGGEQAAADTAELERRWNAEHPGAAFAGKLVGSVGGALATGGIGGIARLAGGGATRALGTGLAGRLASSAAAGLAEGAVFGAAAANDEAFLQQRRLTGEQYLAQAGLGALLGGGLSVVGRGIVEGAGAFRRALGARAAVAASEAGTARVASDVGVAGGGPSQVNLTVTRPQNALRAASDDAIDRAFTAATGEQAAPGMATTLREVLNERPVREQILTRATAEVAPTLNDTAKLSRELTDLVDNHTWKRAQVEPNIAQAAPAALQSTRRLIATQRQELWDAIEEAKKLGPVPKAVTGVEHETVRALHKIAHGDAADAYIALDELRAAQLRTSKALWSIARRGAANADVKLQSEGLAKVIGSHYDQSWQSLMDEGLWGAQGGVQRAVNNARVRLISSEDEALSQFFRQSGTEYEGLGYARPTFEAHEGALMNAIDSMTTLRGAPARRTMDRWIDAVGAFGKGMKGYQLGGLGTKVDELVAKSDALRKTFARVSDQTRALEQAERFSKIQSTLGGIFGNAVGIITNPAVRINHLIRIEQTAERARSEIGRSLDFFFDRMKPIAGRVKLPPPRRGSVSGALTYMQGHHSTPEAGYRARAQALVAENQSGAQGVVGSVANALGPVVHQDPAMAMGMVGAATRGVAFLASKLPVPLNDTQSFTPVSSHPQPNRIELEKFARYYQAVDKPLSVLRDIANGTVTPEQTEALRNVYPELYREIQVQVFERLRKLDQRGDVVPFRQQMVLDSVLDLNGAAAPVLAPEFGAQWGGAIGAAEQQPAPPKPSGKRLRIGDRLASGTDTLIGGSTL